MPPPLRVFETTQEALLAKTQTEVQSLSTLPSLPETTLPSSTTYRNVFGGAFVNVRESPSTTSRVVGTLPQGSTFRVAAERAGWLRLASTGWVLVAHPLYGALLERVDDAA